MVRRLSGIMAAMMLAASVQAATHVEWKNEKVIVHCDKADEWDKNMRIDDAVQWNGRPTACWEHAKRVSIRLPKAPKDWSTHTHVRLFIHSAVKTGSGFIIMLESENPASNGPDYYHLRFYIDWEGWKEFRVPIRKIGPARNPLGYDKLEGVQFISQGWGFTPDPRVVIHFGDISFVDSEEYMMTEGELFDALDFSNPGLEEAGKAWGKKDVDETRKLTAAYFRNRTSVPWRFDPHKIDSKIRHNKAAADRTVAGGMTEVCVDYTYPNGDIDWLYNHTFADPKLPNNNEWQWQLNRMGFWENLGRTYWATQDEIYAQTFVKHLRSWTQQCLEPGDSGNYAKSSWRTIECGIRLLGSWPSAYHYFLHSKSFTDEDLILFLRSSLEQMRHLRKYPTGGNWLTMEMNGVYTFASLFPEFKESKEARLDAMDRIYKSMKGQFLPDGAQFELTPGYHQVALGNIMAIADSALRTNHMDELPSDFIEFLEKAFEYNVKLATPNRDMPRYNDSWRVDVVNSSRRAMSYFPKNETFRWIATDGKEGKEPPYKSCFLPYAGYTAMRSSWSRDANYVSFDVGPLGNAHVHQDKLSLSIWAGGQDILFDDGGGCYESSPFRSYATSAYGHNTILVDGKGQARDHRDPKNRVVSEPIDAHWLSMDEYDYACGTYNQGFGKADALIATQTRQVLFLKPGIVLVADTMEPNDDATHTYQARWNVNCTQLKDVVAGHPALATTLEGKKNLVVVPLLTDGLESRWVSKQETPEVLGWYVIKDAGPYIPAATICHTINGSGIRRFLTMFVILEPGEQSPVKSVKQLSDKSAEVAFADGRVMTIAMEREQLNYSFAK